MSDILNEAYGIVQCKECPWYKACVIPMKFTAQDIKRQIEQGPPIPGAPQQVDQNMENLLSSMATAAQASLLEGCPIFIERLRSSPKLAQRIKELMLNWGGEEKP
ncbi:MAG TPA: hypothetical protein VMB24_03870 [Dehalococcoidales bacterium]|nr:hypothetical protein [Dehalococcoidales bacterium]